MYNKTYFAEHHWPAPTSWNDLEDPKYKGKLVIPPLNNTYGLHALVEFAKLGGGGEKNIEPGFKAFQDQVGQFELRQIQRNVGITTVLVTHDQAEAMALSDRIAIMNMGRVEQIARPDCAYERPASPFVAGFLGKSNRLSGRIEAGSVRIADAAWPAPAGFAAGEVAVTVRPENIGFAADGLRGAVRTRLFLGSQWLFQIDTPAGLVLVIRQSTGTAVPAEGEAVSLAWRPEDMRIARAEVPAS
jgi:putative spermidine/putrescine transport system ATP-binding protein